MRGRRPKPTALADLHGDPGKLGKATIEARMVVERIDARMDAPADFSASQIEVWTDALASAPAGVLRRIDSSVLIAWVVACDLHRQARDDLGRSTLLVKAPHRGNMMVTNPLIGIITQQSQIMMKTSEQLGFTPTSRSRVAMLGGGVPLGVPAPKDQRKSKGKGAVELKDYLASAPPAPVVH